MKVLACPHPWQQLQQGHGMLITPVVNKAVTKCTKSHKVVLFITCVTFLALQVISMRCVLCGGPFNTPTHEHASTGLTGPTAAYKWLGCWCRLPSIPEKRKRGEPAAFYAHLDCLKLLQNKLGTLPEHRVIWACIKETQTDKAASIPDTLPAGFYLGLADLLQSFVPGTRSSSGSNSCAAANSWMLHSPLRCSQNASRSVNVCMSLIHGMDCLELTVISLSCKYMRNAHQISALAQSWVTVCAASRLICHQMLYQACRHSALCAHDTT